MKSVRADAAAAAAATINIDRMTSTMNVARYRGQLEYFMIIGTPTSPYGYYSSADQRKWRW